MDFASGIAVAPRRKQVWTTVVLADHDPLSRHALAEMLRAEHETAAQVNLVGVVDSHLPAASWPDLERGSVVVLAVDPIRDFTGLIRDLTARGAFVLAVAGHWDARSLDSTLAAGATGCVVKEVEMSGLGAAVHAVATGHLLLSPQLMRTHLPTRPGDSLPGTETVSGSLTFREYEVLSLLGNGMSTAEAARALGVSAATVKSHVSHALPKLGARNRIEAVLIIKDGHYSVPAPRARR